MQSHKIALKLSAIIVFLAVITSVGGLLIENLYQDSATIQSAWLSNDIVTLFLAAPLLIIALKLVKNGSEKGQLLWVGLLGYMTYNYAFYLFGAAFNWFFLMYVAIFALSIYALILSLAGLDVTQISQQFSEKTPNKWISLFLLLISLPLAFIEIGQIISFISRKEDPGILSLVYALDLSIVVPNTALAAILLWKRHKWGYVLGAIMLIKAFIYGLVLSIATAIISKFSLTGYWDPLMPFYLFVTLGGLLGSIGLLNNMKFQSKTILT